MHEALTACPKGGTDAAIKGKQELDRRKNRNVLDSTARNFGILRFTT